VVSAGSAYFSGSPRRGLAKHLGQIGHGDVLIASRASRTILAARGYAGPSALPEYFPLAGEYLAALKLGHRWAAMQARRAAQPVSRAGEAAGCDYLANPSPAAAATAGRTPRTGRSRPSRPNSPKKITPSTAARGTLPAAVRIPTAIARANIEM